MTTPLRVNRWTTPRHAAAPSAFTLGYGTPQKGLKTLECPGTLRGNECLSGLEKIARAILGRRFRLGLRLNCRLLRLRGTLGLWLRLGHFGVGRSHRPRRDHLVALAVAVRVHDAE